MLELTERRVIHQDLLGAGQLHGFTLCHKTVALGMDGTAKYLYNAATADVYPVIEETKQNCAVWYWKGKKAALYGLDEDPEKQQEFLDALEFYGVTEVYYSIGANKLVNSVDMVEMFVKNAYARNMKVYLLTGENTWLYEDSYQTAIYRVFDRVAEYNSMVDYDARLAGVSYDAEVWTNKAYNWKNDDAVRGQQVAFIQTAQQYADSQNLSVSFCLPFWIVRYHYTDANGETQNVYDAITKAANDTILMAYRDSAEAVERLVAEVQTGAVQTALAYAEQNDCNLEIAVQADDLLVVSDHFDHLSVRLAHAQLIAANGQFHRIAQRGYLAHIHLRAAGEAHIHNAALERALAVQLFNHCGFTDLDVLQGFHSSLSFLFTP